MLGKAKVFQTMLGQVYTIQNMSEIAWQNPSSSLPLHEGLPAHN